MESDLDSQVPHAFAFGDPLEPHLPAPLPLFVPFAGPNRTRFVPIDFCSGRLAKDVQNLLSLYHVFSGTLEVECGVVREGLVRDLSASWESQAFHPESGVV